MFNKKLLLTFSLLILALSSITGVFAQDNSSLRFVHAIPGAAVVDIYVDGQLTAANLDFGEATAYISVPAAAHQITVTPAGATTPLWEQSFTPGAGRAYTLVASSFDEPVEFSAFEDLLDPLPLGKARFTTIHAIADAPAIDVLLDDGQAMVIQQSYNQPFGTLDVPVFTYNLVVVPSGEGVESALLTLDNVALNTGTSYMLLLYGTAANPQSALLSAPTKPETGEVGFVKLVHAVPDAPAVDVYLNDGILAATLFSPTEGSSVTDYLALPAGDYDVELRAAGADDALLTASATVNSGDHVTAIAQGAADDIALNFLTDDVNAIAPDQALVRVINAAPEAVSASFSNGTVLVDELASGEASAVTSTLPEILGLTVGASELPNFEFYGGTFYDVVALGDSIELSAAALAQGIGSAPGAASIAAQPTLPPPAATPAPEQATPVPAQPTTAPAVIAPPVIPTDAPPTGRVFNLNIDANLQLRQYPDTNALSLGVVPFGTMLTVNGRQGPLAEIFISATQIPPDYEYVDPVGLLPDETADLAPEETWLNVLYATPDGGTIEAWVRADFIDVRDAGGKQVRLRDLPTVPGNRPGEARNTSITPPQPQEDVVTVRVINLDPTANLNVRRTPDTTGEVLAQLPLNTVAEYLGQSESGEWIFLRYSAPEGIVTTGWASAGFLEIGLNGEKANLERLEAEGLLTTADETQRGSQTVGAAPVAVPTLDPTIDVVIAEVALDPGANLNLRRQPDQTAEVLAQIPSGTRVIVTERTPNAQWLLVTYEGVEGWIAAQTDTAVFVRLSFNGGPFAIEEVPVSAQIAPANEGTQEVAG